MKLSGYGLAKALNVTARRVSDIVLKKSGVSADMAIRLAKFFGTSPEFWMNLQTSYELAIAGKTLRKQIQRIKPRRENIA
jgi:addiction module HigA family antidote